MNGPISLAAVMFGLLIVAIMLAAPWSTNATGQSDRPTAVTSEHKPAAPALLAFPPEHQQLPVPLPTQKVGGAHRRDNATGLDSTELVERAGPVKTFPGQPIPFKAAGRD